ncbi:ABC transporter permease [Rhodocyclaceae bacterium]|jgi:uncharacterized GH25 family protein|nr:ABC transporter permease [Rhodocyclaceae bacterium]
MIKHRIALAALTAALAAPLAQAHETWLVPSSTVLSSNGYVTVDAAVSNQVFHFNYRPLSVGQSLSILAADGSAVQAENLVQGQLRSVFDVKLDAPGTYRIAVANAAVMASWKENGQPKRIRGTAAEIAEKVPPGATDLVLREVATRIETFVTVGSPTELKPVGEGLEMVPVTHPNDLYAGEEVSFAFHANGQAAKQLKVAIVEGGTRYRDRLDKVELLTDEQGRIRHVFARPGLYYLNAVMTGKSPINPDMERRLSYTATLEVLPQ